jgi:hypothetical protein
MAIQVKTVSVHYERKQNLGDFSSATIGCTLWADVTEDENLDEAMHALWGMARENVKANLVPEVQAAKGRGAMQIEAQFLGLPVKEV